MRNYSPNLWYFAIFCLLTTIFVPNTLLGESTPNPKVDGQSGLQQRIDFGNAHIMGQSIKSGAVYLMHRKKSNIDSMLKIRQDYRDEILKEYGVEDTALAEKKAYLDSGNKQ